MAKRKNPKSGNPALGRGAALSFGAVMLAAGAALFGLVRRGSKPAEGHVPTDLLSDTRPGPGDRAPDAFRPDPTASVSESEREALRPATIPVAT